MTGHYITDFLKNTKYHNKLEIISHFDIKISNKPHVYFSHGVGENIEIANKPYNSDYYLCWNKAEYKYLTKLNKRVYLVGSIYNEETFPRFRKPEYLTYIPMHSFRQDLEMRSGQKLPDNVDIPDLVYPILTANQLQHRVIKEGLYNHVTSLVDDSNKDYFRGHNILSSDRYANSEESIASHFRKCRLLYEQTDTAIVDLYGTWDLVAANHNIKLDYRRGNEVPLNYQIEKQESFIAHNYKDMIDMPMKDNKKLIMEALDEIYSQTK